MTTLSAASQAGPAADRASCTSGFGAPCSPPPQPDSSPLLLLKTMPAPRLVSRAPPPSPPPIGLLRKWCPGTQPP